MRARSGLALILVLAAPAASQVVLWDQRDRPSGDGIPDQDFEAAFDEFDSEAADDFVVDWPDGWRVEVVRTIGDQSLERRARSVDVAIHTNIGGRPAAGAVPGCEAQELVPTDEDDGSFELHFPDVCELPPGHYWLVMQTNQDFDPSGQHFWSSRSQSRGLPALWRNPGDGFDTGCREWGTLVACEAGGSFPDLLFSLEGQLLDPPPVLVGAVESAVAGASVPAIAVAPSGTWALAWRREDRIEVRRFDDRGQPLAPSTQVFRGASAGAPLVGIDELGGLAVVWERPGGGIQARFYDESGTATRPAFQVVPVGRSPALARGPQGFTVVVWQDEGGGGILARRYDRDGNALGSPIGIDASSTGLRPAVAMGRDGVWTVAWIGADGSLRIRSFQPNGAGLGSELQVAAAIDVSVAPALVSRGGRDLAIVALAGGELLTQVWLAGIGAIAPPVALGVVDTATVPVTRLVAAANTFGEVVVAWELDSGANSRLLTRFVGVDGEPLGSALDFGFGRDRATVVLDPAGQARVASQRGDEVATQRLLIRPADCEDSFALCLGGPSGDRFSVRVAWKAFDGRMGVGFPQTLTADTGWFWFFGPSNVEVVLKVLDGRPVNGSFWVFYAALSNVEFTISAVDRQTGEVAVYHNVEGRFASVGDTAAFPLGVSGSLPPENRLSTPDPRAPTPPRGPAKAGPCVATSEILCLFDGRFAVTTSWRDFEGNTGTGKASPLAGDTTGYFWFFNPNNVEIVTKVLDGRVLNGKFWVFVGALSNVEFSITVKDLETGAEVVYTNPAGTFASFADTNAL